MGFLNDERELLRKRRLAELEDKRLRFAEWARQASFAPKEMLIASTERGGMIGLCRDGGDICVVIGPDFGGEGEFMLERYRELPVRREEVFEQAQGMGGLLGFGRKATKGFVLIVERDGSELTIPFVANRNQAALYRLSKNPLLSERRRRGDANIVWDIPPIEPRRLSDIERMVSQILE